MPGYKSQGNQVGSEFAQAVKFARRLLASHRVAPAANLVIASEDPGDGFGVGDVLFGEDAAAEGVGVVGVKDGDGALEDDGSVVELVVDEMDRAAGHFDSVVEGLLLGFEAGEGGQQRGMNVEDAVAVSSDKFRREQAQVAGQADEVDLVLAQAGEEVAVVIGARAALGDKRSVRQSHLSRSGQSRGFGDVGDDDGDFRAGQLSRPDGLSNGEEVGAAAGEEDAEADVTFS